MPIYSYQCQECKTKFEKIQKVTDETIPECPSCESKAVERTISTGVRVNLKGGGWYKSGMS